MTPKHDRDRNREFGGDRDNGPDREHGRDPEHGNDHDHDRGQDPGREHDARNADQDPQRNPDQHGNDVHDLDDENRDLGQYELMASSNPSGPERPDETSERHAAQADGARTNDAQDDEGLSSEEEVLRRLLHDTVEDIRPSAYALDHLRRAIPARRAHRRQAMVGIAASLMLAVTAAPALIHTANTAGNSASTPGGDATQHSEQGGKGESDLGPTRGPGSQPTGGGETQGKADQGKGSGGSKTPSGRPPGKGGGAPDPSDTMIAGAPECVPAQLSQSPAVIGAADADGRVYGSFRVVNGSQEDCSVSAPGELNATAQGSADPARITVAAHSPGDPATGLPDVAAQTLVLAPGDAYVVKFGWVPESGTNGCDTSSDPSAGGGDPGTASGTGSDTGGDAGGSGDPSGSPAGSVALTYTPPGGAASASGQIADACAGTVYHTPPMADA